MPNQQTPADARGPHVRGRWQKAYSRIHTGKSLEVLAAEVAAKEPSAVSRGKAVPAARPPLRFWNRLRESLPRTVSKDKPEATPVATPEPKPESRSAAAEHNIFHAKELEDSQAGFDSPFTDSVLKRGEPGSTPE